MGNFIYKDITFDCEHVFDELVIITLRYTQIPFKGNRLSGFVCDHQQNCPIAPKPHHFPDGFCPFQVIENKYKSL